MLPTPSGTRIWAMKPYERDKVTGSKLSINHQVILSRIRGPGFVRRRRLFRKSGPKSMLPKLVPLNSGQITSISLRSKRYRIKRPTWILRSQSKTSLSARLETKVLKPITDNACAMQKKKPCSNVSHQKRESECASGCTPTSSWLPWWTATTPSSATTTSLPLCSHAPRLSLSRQPPKAKTHVLLNCG